MVSNSFEYTVNFMKKSKVVPFGFLGYPLELGRKVCKKWSIQFEVCDLTKICSIRVGHFLLPNAPTKDIFRWKKWHGSKNARSGDYELFQRSNGSIVLEPWTPFIHRNHWQKAKSRNQ